MEQKELTQLLIEALNKKKNRTAVDQNLDHLKLKKGSKNLVHNIVQGEEMNEEIISSMIKNLKNNSNPFHDLAALLAKKYASSDLEKLVKNAEIFKLESDSDAYVSEYYTSKNFGRSDALFTGRYYKQDAIYRSYLYFNIGSIPADIKITDVTMKLNLHPTGLNQDTKINIYPLLQPWREDTICWRNQPKATRQPYASISISTHDTEIAGMQITDLFKYWYLKPGKNYGLLLQGEENADALLAFKSKEYPNSAMRPRLEISYNA